MDGPIDQCNVELRAIMRKIWKRTPERILDSLVPPPGDGRRFNKNKNARISMYSTYNYIENLLLYLMDRKLMFTLPCHGHVIYSKRCHLKERNDLDLHPSHPEPNLGHPDPNPGHPDPNLGHPIPNPSHLDLHPSHLDLHLIHPDPHLIIRTRNTEKRQEDAVVRKYRPFKDRILLICE